MRVAMVKATAATATATAAAPVGTPVGSTAPGAEQGAACPTEPVTDHGRTEMEMDLARGLALSTGDENGLSSRAGALGLTDD